MQVDTLSDKHLDVTIEVVGKWWHPGEPESSMIGVLSFTPITGPKLVLIKDYKLFVGQEESMAFEMLLGIPNQDEKIIHGLTMRGEAITLLECHRQDADVIIGGSSFYTYHFEVLLVGALFNSVEEMRFGALEVEYPYLDKLIGELGAREFGPILADTYSLQIVAKNSSNIAHRIQVNANATEPLSLVRSLAIQYTTQQFLSLVTLEPIFPLAIDLTATQLGTRVRMFRSTVGLREPTRGVFDINYMFLSNGEILDSFEHCFKNFVIDQDLQDLYKQFFDFFYSPPPLGENRFLGLVQAIEGFHRAASTEVHMNKRDYERRVFPELKKTVRGLKEAEIIPEDFEPTLIQRFISAYELILGERIQSLLEAYGQQYLKLFVKGKNAEEFSKYVTKLRNYYTHPAEKKDFEAPGGKELDILNNMLELLFVILVLNRIGMPAGKLDKAISRSKFAYLR
jgi:hypothetical protein